MARMSDRQSVLFAIPLKNPKDEAEAVRIDRLLALTLNSLRRQTNDSYTIGVCGHVPPEYSLANYPELRWFEAPFPPPQQQEDFRQDKHLKRAHITASLRSVAPFYYMPLDGDDLIHRSCVDFALSKGDKAGFYFSEGYALNFRGGTLARIPGVFKQEYFEVCGSSAFLYMEKDDLPESWDDASKRLFWRVLSHPTIPKHMARHGRPLKRFPLRGGIYVVNNGANISYGLVKGRASMVDRMAAFAVKDNTSAMHRFVDPKKYLEAREALDAYSFDETD